MQSLVTTDYVIGPSLLLEGITDRFFTHSIFLISTIATAYFRSNLFYPFAIATTAQLFSTVILKFTQESKLTHSMPIQIKFAGAQHKSQRIQIVAFLVVLVTTHHWFSSLRFAFAAAAGAYIAFVSSNTTSKQTPTHAEKH